MTSAMPAASPPPAPSVVDLTTSPAPTDGWLFTVVHHAVNGPGDVALLDATADLAKQTGHLLATWPRHDRITFVFDATGGRIAVLALQAYVVLQGRFWWRTFTRFGGDA